MHIAFSWCPQSSNSKGLKMSHSSGAYENNSCITICLLSQDHAKTSRIKRIYSLSPYGSKINILSKHLKQLQVTFQTPSKRVNNSSLWRNPPRHHTMRAFTKEISMKDHDQNEVHVLYFNEIFMEHLSQEATLVPWSVLRKGYIRNFRRL